MSKLILSMVLGVCMASAYAGESLKWKDKPGEVFFQSEIKIREGIAAKVELNGITIASDNGNGAKVSSAVPHYFIEKGGNDIKIFINKFLFQGNSSESDIQVILHGASKGSIPDESSIVAQYSIDDLAPSDAPKLFSLDFTAQSAPPNGIAVPSQVVSLTNEDKEKIEYLLQTIINAFKAGDGDAYFDVMKYSIEASRAKFYEEFDEEKERASTVKQMRFFEDLKDVDFNLNDLALIGVNDNKYFVAQNVSNGRPFIYKRNPEANGGSGVNLAFSKASNGAWYVSSTVISPVEQPTISQETRQRLIEKMDATKKPEVHPNPEDSVQKRGGGIVAAHVPDSNEGYQGEYDFLLGHYTSIMPEADAKRVMDGTLKALDGQTDQIKKNTLASMVEQIKKMQ